MLVSCMLVLFVCVYFQPHLSPDLLIEVASVLKKQIFYKYSMFICKKQKNNKNGSDILHMTHLLKGEKMPSQLQSSSQTVYCWMEHLSDEKMHEMHEKINTHLRSDAQA